MPPVRRVRALILSVIFVFITLYYLTNTRNTWNYGYTSYIPRPAKPNTDDGRVHWSKLPERYPVTSFIPLPTGKPKNIPAVQAPQPVEDGKQREERLRRARIVKESFTHSWNGYKKYAWLRDEVSPISNKWKDTFGGWAATLVDSLDTLWIMGMKEDFELAVHACQQIDFTTTDAKDINVFETTIRYLGGFLAAYDISGGKYPTLLSKAVEVGELLMACFDTPNRMPISRWDWKEYMTGVKQTAPQRMVVSELGSMSVEFTRLSQLTGDKKYYDAIQRVGDVFEKSQNTTKLPGMWPVSVDAAKPAFDEDNWFTLGGMSDSLYEYFPKQYLMLGGLLAQPKNLYENFIEVAKRDLFVRFLNPKDEPLLVAGDIRATGTNSQVRPQGQHLTCFTGGMVGLGSRIFDKPNDLEIAKQLTAGCIWAYDNSANGIAPEIFTLAACPKNSDGTYSDCSWSEAKWHDALKEAYPPGDVSEEEAQKSIQTVIKDRRLPPGFTAIDARKYILRPEAIESVFIMYRITGEQKWADAAWRMFQKIEGVTRTETAASAIWDITVEPKDVSKERMDSMESFWLAETLKYFYLCFQEFGVVSLDEYVLNTEAHPLKRPGR